MKSLYLRLWSHISTQRRLQFGFLFLLMIVASFAEVLSIGAIVPFLGVLTAPDQIFEKEFIQPFIQILHLKEPRELLLPLTIIFCITVIASGAMRLVLVWFQTRISFGIGADLSINIYRRTLYQPYSVHLDRNSSEVISGIAGKANAVVGVAIMPILTILSSILILFSILSVLISIDPVATIFSFTLFGAIYILISFITKNLIARYSKLISIKWSNVFKALQEGLGGIRDVLIDGTQATYCAIYRNADLPLRHARANIAIIANAPRYGIEALGMVMIAALSFVLAGSSDEFVTVIPILGALALGAQKLLPIMQQTFQCLTQIRGGKDSFRDALNLLDQPLPLYLENPHIKSIHFQNNIILNNLAFRYNPKKPLVLDELNLTILKGTRIGFTGTTGSGKSTLLDIIMGLLQPTKGSLTIDDVPITSQNNRNWQVHIAHVPQSIFLSDISISENIAFGIPYNEIDFNRVQEAAQKAQISNTIESWKNQYNTLVGERGIRLSGGQRQRIGIARALYKQADVIIFDEATSALDNETEHAVMEAIANISKDITVIIVAHRLTTLQNCNIVVELVEGKIKRIGSYKEITT